MVVIDRAGNGIATVLRVVKYPGGDVGVEKKGFRVVTGAEVDLRLCAQSANEDRNISQVK